MSNQKFTTKKNIKKFRKMSVLFLKKYLFLFLFFIVQRYSRLSLFFFFFFFANPTNLAFFTAELPPRFFSTATYRKNSLIFCFISLLVARFFFSTFPVRFFLFFFLCLFVYIDEAIILFFYSNSF